MLALLYYGEETGNVWALLVLKGGGGRRGGRLEEEEMEQEAGFETWE